MVNSNNSAQQITVDVCKSTDCSRRYHSRACYLQLKITSHRICIHSTHCLPDCCDRRTGCLFLRTIKTLPFIFTLCADNDVISNQIYIEINIPYILWHIWRMEFICSPVGHVEWTFQHQLSAERELIVSTTFIHHLVECCFNSKNIFKQSLVFECTRRVCGGVVICREKLMLTIIENEWIASINFSFWHRMDKLNCQSSWTWNCNQMCVQDSVVFRTIWWRRSALHMK